MATTLSAFMIAYTTALLGLALNRTHLMSALLCLEALMLSLFMGLSAWMLGLDTAICATSPIFLMTLSVCEAGAGLALLVATARTHGSSHLRSLSLLQC